MPRDDFTRATIEILAKRAAQCCSNPDCRGPTSGAHSQADKAIMIGVAAHISAAACGGPRYDSSMSSLQRQAAENGIWLCQNCAKLIDSDVVKFSTATLHQWKARAELDSNRALTNERNSQPAPQSLDTRNPSLAERDLSREEIDFLLDLSKPPQEGLLLKNLPPGLILDQRLKVVRSLKSRGLLDEDAYSFSLNQAGKEAADGQWQLRVLGGVGAACMLRPFCASDELASHLDLDEGQVIRHFVALDQLGMVDIQHHFNFSRATLTETGKKYLNR